MKRGRGLCGALVLVGAGLCLVTPRAARAARDSETDWSAWVQEATTALQVGDDETARLAITRLQRLRPEDPLPAYLEGRQLERMGRRGEAADRYRAVILECGSSLAPEWVELLSGRWVRAARRGDEDWVRSALEQETPPASVPGRHLVLPFEPLQVEEATAAQREELVALGHAAAYWVISAWSADSPGEAIGLHAALLLRQGQVPPEPGRDPQSETTLAPVTTLMGAALRLQELEPAGPPPWAPDAARPERYLEPESVGERVTAVASALAHFQSEHGLAPSGVLDAATRQSLERAYRTQKAKRAARARPPATADPALAAARLAGAETALTGTIEAISGGDVRWSAAWISARDGSLLSVPLSGLLPQAHFAEAWDHLVRSIRAAAPGADTAAPRLPSPTREGAVSFGRALQLVEPGRARSASEMFRRAARAGAGSIARWLADAWSPSEDLLLRWEEELLEREIHGPQRLDPAWVTEETRFLGRRLVDPGRAAASLERPAGLAFLPEQGWLQIIGHVE